MDKQIIEKFKNKLEEVKADLEKEVSQLKTVPDFGDDIDSMEEEADESAAYGDQLASAESFKERVADINLALAKIEKGEYGICEECGNEISAEVLEVNPESKLCQNDKKKSNNQ